MMKWKRFSDEWPKCKFVFIVRPPEIYDIRVENINHGLSWCKPEYLWAEANIDYPTVLNQQFHCCERDYLRCEETESGNLQIYSIKTIYEKHPDRPPTMLPPVRVKTCPFCGWSKDKK